MASKKGMSNMAEMPKMKPTVHLDHDALKDMGMHKGPMPKVGAKLPMKAMGHVVSVGEDDSGRRMTMELHDMGMDGTNEKPAPDSDSIGKGMKKAMDKAVPGPNRTKRGTEVDNDPEE
jgi:hypothetical protein